MFFRAPAQPEAQRAPWIQALAQQGLDPCVADSGNCWIRVHKFGRLRYPPNNHAELEPGESAALFLRHRAMLVDSHRLAKPGENANAYLYLCRDRDYDVAKLSQSRRRDARRGLRRHEVREITPQEMLATGYACVADTSRRHALRPPSEDAFRASCLAMQVSPFFQVWGAMAEDELAAYMILRYCGPWAEIVTCGSADKHLKHCPNQALVTTVLKQSLSALGVESVSYGLSSLQLHSRADSLHWFKTSMGFEAIPVVRSIKVHPVLAPLFNRATGRVLRVLERKCGDVLAIRQASALVEMLIGGETARLPEPHSNDGENSADARDESVT
jgi:hypothetical protein